MSDTKTGSGRPAAEKIETTEAEIVTRPRSEPCGDLPLAARVEALLISAERPLGEARISALLALPGKGTARQVAQAVDKLNGEYEKSERSFRIERLAGGWQILTRPEYGELLVRLHADRQQSRLSQAALETLAIIAYRQPIMRAEIETIRGVACGEVLRGLLERRMIKVVGRAEELGRPMLYGTTKEFLKVFGLSGTDDLPAIEGAKPRPGAAASAAPPQEAPAGGPDKPPGFESPEDPEADTPPEEG
ncbi:MAG: SMC-Scp complex subunit ScpB [Phycisphaerales bacterium]|nr:MAG: SMC-Scp complex subunit ScpB [Phycisphaerales bacterium]